MPQQTLGREPFVPPTILLLSNEEKLEHIKLLFFQESYTFKWPQLGPMKSYRPMDQFPIKSRRVESEFRGLRHISLEEHLQKSKSNFF